MIRELAAYPAAGDADVLAASASPTFSYASDEVSKISQGVIRLIELASGQRKVVRLYEAYRQAQRPAEAFWQDAVRTLRLDLRFDRDPLRWIPAAGPHVVVANHPFGIVDGVILCWMVSQVRRDFKIMTHRVLYQAPEVREHIIPIDFSETREATLKNIAARRDAERILAAGGVLIVFPAGAVAMTKGPFGRAVDFEWKPFVAKMLLRTGADVLPVFFHGQNSRLYQVAGNISLTLKLSLLFHEAVNKIGSPVTVSIRDMIPNETLRRIGSRQDVIAFLKAATFAA
jgi:putative hemolysin